MLHGAVEPDDFASSVLLAEAVLSGDCRKFACGVRVSGSLFGI